MKYYNLIFDVFICDDWPLQLLINNPVSIIIIIIIITSSMINVDRSKHTITTRLNFRNAFIFYTNDDSNFWWILKRNCRKAIFKNKEETTACCFVYIMDIIEMWSRLLGPHQTCQVSNLLTCGTCPTRSSQKKLSPILSPKVKYKFSSGFTDFSYQNHKSWILNVRLYQ